MVKKRCKICKYFSSGHGQYRQTEKAIFEHKLREGVSLRELSKYLEYSCRLKVSHNLIRNHIKNCMSKDVKAQRDAEKGRQKANKSLKNRVKSIFFRSTEDLKIECKHQFTESWFQDGKVWTRCKSCNEVLGCNDPQEKSRNSREKTLILLEALMK